MVGTTAGSGLPARDCGNFPPPGRSLQGRLQHQQKLAHLVRFRLAPRDALLERIHRAVAPLLGLLERQEPLSASVVERECEGSLAQPPR